ncbi:CRISPR-associated protein Cas4 [Paenactinomyces guangxiensis]|uniref:CRISPR-associated exonuclease Cas4 n=1 Tax=Paenactinomyces guangxiensis TaxID=1490290 RepID=A0A7W1WNQ1_9BACL|nr:CRISPR-associated protein Cas4 [Paenactinomyces guangxiensis]MBA4493254.1 CRISPR-associated protein Cas4 [Paenactinomyces guangxiensis]MBH8589895.1 CRISPR-associated protein Cas4 [Paenactinomyces guangxiensis]
MDIHSIGGQHLYYLESCKRQLWLYLKKVDMEEGFESVELGRLIHEETFEREEKEIRIGGFVIDFISEDGFIHETKSSKQVKQEHESQPLFYAYYLKNILGFDHIQGVKIHYPAIKEVVTIPLDQKKNQKIKQKIDEILEVSRLEEMPPLHSNTKLCRKCAYFEFCYS